METNSDQQYKIYEYQVGGRTLMLRSADGKRVLKKILKKNQYIFYMYLGSLHVTHPHYPLTKYLPKCYRLLQSQIDIDYSTDSLENVNSKVHEWFHDIRKNKRNSNIRDHRLFMQMENFSYKYRRLNLMDVKIGKMPRKTHNMLAVNKNVKVTGVLKTFPDGQTQFASRVQVGGIIDEENFVNLLAYFFTDNEYRLLPSLITAAIESLKQISLAFRAFQGWQFNSASICFLYNSQDLSMNQIRAIDFGRVSSNQLLEQYDKNLINGISNLIRYFEQILSNQQKYTINKLSFKKDKFYDDDQNEQKIDGGIACMGKNENE